jgi:N,N'-diacetyllegionaminate synthase
VNIGKVNLNTDVFIIAEIGNNHEGSIELAKELILKAADCGVDAVKFQSITPSELMSPLEIKRLNQLKRFEFNFNQFLELKELADSVGVGFMSTPFSRSWISKLSTICPALKIASGDNNYDYLLEDAARSELPIILSTGMTDLAGVKRACDLIMNIWGEEQKTPGLVLLHCVSAYPTPLNQANLGAINTLRSISKWVGYSDHTIGINAAVMAVSLGACVIEKHFTISKSYSDFRDHQLSADPEEMTLLVERVREAKVLMGDGCKRIMPVEVESNSLARRSIIITRKLNAGAILCSGDFDLLRPGSGMPPSQAGAVIGRKIKKQLEIGHQLSTLDLE